ncbi:MAG TPA: YhbY family RNA-binding protein [Methanoregulaceae archaeon]|nr:YhbY family RNA-binding protein [Methanoregulaceae archaeon]
MSQSRGSTWRKAAEGRNPGSRISQKRVVKSNDTSRKPGGDRRPGKYHGTKQIPRNAGKPDERVLMQELKPTVWIGKQGCTETIVSEVTAQLKSRKVIKVKWLQNIEIVPEDLARAAGARLLAVRGRTLVLEERRKL